MSRRRRATRSRIPAVLLLVLLVALVLVFGTVRPKRAAPARPSSSHPVGVAPRSERTVAPEDGEFGAPRARGIGTSERLPAAEMERSRPIARAYSGLAESPHLALGVPVDSDPSDDLLLDEREFVISYNPKHLDPNWVAWRLDGRYLGHVPRKNRFRPDESLPVTVHHVTPHDYQHSGYDRGHMCPSADRDATPEMNSITFLMTNMIPQLHELNAGPWEKLEEYERELAERPDAELYIVAGGVFGTDPRTIGAGIAVPRATYKIIVSLRGHQTAREVKGDAEVISVIIPNEAGVGNRPWTDFVTSVDEVERETGYDFLPALSDPIERTLEARTPSVP